MGSDIRTQATHDTIADGSIRVLYCSEDIGFPQDATTIQAAIVVPITVGNAIEGTLKFYYRSAKKITETQKSIAQGFGRLLSTQMAATEMERQRKLATSMELKMLQSQINPHFLFNTINTIASLIRTDPTKARTLLRDFAVFYRRTLEDSSDRIMLSREIEQTMRYFAREYDPENEEFWGIVGLLHDLDWEEHDDEPEMHTLYATPLIEAAGGSPELIRAIQSHTSDYNTDLPKPELQMEKILFATEELTGLIGAAIVMRPGGLSDLEVSSVKKKFKDKRFAAGVSRDVIRSGAEMLGWELDELFARTIEAMQSFAPDRDTFTPAE